MDLNKELSGLDYASYPEIFDKFRKLSSEYGDIPADNLVGAFARVTGQQMMINNPYIQNRRVKHISSLPVNFTKDEVAKMITAPDSNEQPIRQVSHALEYTAYPMFHMRKLYQDLLTYHNYIAPQFAEKEDVKKDDFWREWKLLEKLRRKLDPESVAHMIAGQTLQEGKVFYYPRFSIDKPHNRVNYAFMQQLPSDWTKIVGFNSDSKYTIAFNMMYFTQPGTTPYQFGDLFAPYLSPFQQIVTPAPKGAGKEYAYAAKASVDMTVYTRIKDTMEGEPEVYYQNGKWFYWVTLPVDKVFTFEVDDVSRNAVSPFTGLFLSMIQLAQYEAIQLELIQNPLVSLITGEIPYRDDKESSQADSYKLSNAGRRLFEALWYQMLAQTNTSGIGLYMAPLENMTMHTLAEAPSAMEISSNGYEYTISKAGLAGIMPSSSDTRAGMAQISMQIESRFAETIYRDFERMMAVIFRRMNLKYEWRFEMFGNLATDKDMEDAAMKGMTAGLLPETLIYNALHNRSILDDLSVSTAIAESGIMDMRQPLVTSYSARNPDSGLPPSAKQTLDPGGRPSSEGKATSEGAESDLDAPTD